MLPLRQLALCILVGGLSGSPAQARDVPFVPTPDQVVRQMLEMAQAGPDDIVYDLGSGDGRIVIAAVRDFGVRKGIGIDIDPQRVEEAIANAQREGVSDRVQFLHADIFDADFSDATVVTMYLLKEVNLRLRPRLLTELRPGTRLVSHQFHMGGWQADAVRQSGGRSIYHWIVPARVEGVWTWTAEGRTYVLDLQQQYQMLTGYLQLGGRLSELQDTELRGDRLRFETQIMRDGNAVPARFAGRIVEDGVLRGSLAIGDAVSEIEARRTP